MPGALSEGGPPPGTGLATGGPEGHPLASPRTPLPSLGPLPQAEGFLRRAAPPPTRRRLRLPKASHVLLTPRELREIVAADPGRSLALAFGLAALVLLVLHGLAPLRIAVASLAVIAVLYLLSGPSATLAPPAVLTAALFSASIGGPLLLGLQAGLLAGVDGAGLPMWLFPLLAPLLESLFLAAVLRLLLSPGVGGSLGWRCSASDLMLLGAGLGAGLDLLEGLLQPGRPVSSGPGAPMAAWVGIAGHTVYGALVGLLLGRAWLGTRGQWAFSEGAWLVLAWGWLERAVVPGLVQIRPLELPAPVWQALPWLSLQGVLGLALLGLLMPPTLLMERRILHRHRAVDQDAAERSRLGLRPPAGVGRAVWLRRLLERRPQLVRLSRRVAYLFHYTAFTAQPKGEESEAARLLAVLRLCLLAHQAELEAPSIPF